MQRRSGATARHLHPDLTGSRALRALALAVMALAALSLWGCSTPPNAAPDGPTQQGVATSPANAPDAGPPSPDPVAAGDASPTAPPTSAPPSLAPRPLQPVLASAAAALADAVEAAKAATPPSGGDPDDVRAQVEAALAAPAEDPDAAAAQAAKLLATFAPNLDSFSDRALLIRLALRARDLPTARAQAWAAAEAADTSTDPDAPALRQAFMQLWYESFAQDPVFFPPTLLTLEEGDEGDKITKLAVMSREGTSILFKAKRGDTTVGVLKPMQRLWLSNYRGEIAAYRLCPLIHCGFTMPHNQEARIHKATFNRIHAEDKDWMENRKGKGIVLVWFKDDGKEYLYGTYKSWEPGFALFPIEDSALWEDTLKVDGTPLETLQDMPFTTFMKPFSKKHEKKYKGILERANGVTTMAFLRQLSNLHVYDALTNNWDRYTGQPYPGLNCQFNHGQFVSIDNGATFQNKKDQKDHADYYSNAGRRMRTRIGRYSRSTINALRWMDDEAVRALLFPPSPHHTDEDERFELFIERRDAILKHVDKLIATHGEDKVLVFP
jgi:hypothetical protein